MAQIDKLIEMMHQRQAERVVLMGGQPLRLMVNGEAKIGAAIPTPRLESLLDEIAPESSKTQLQQNGKLEFNYPTAEASFKVTVVRSSTSLTASIAPAPKEVAEKDRASEGQSSTIIAPDNEAILEIMSFETLASSPQACWFFVHKGRRFGPVSYDIVKDLCVERELSKDDLLWRQGMAGWEPIGSTDFKKFYETLGWLTPERGIVVLMGVGMAACGGYVFGKGIYLGDVNSGLGLLACGAGGKLVSYGRHGMGKSPARIFKCLNPKCKLLNILTRTKCIHCGGDLELIGQGSADKQK